MRSAGITGPPAAGKTSLLRALAGERAIHVAAIQVSDPRLDALATFHGSGRKTAPNFDVFDIHHLERTEAAALARLRTMDSLVGVIPGFGGRDPASELTGLRETLILSDLGPIEHRLERAKKDSELRGEVTTLEQARAQLGEGEFLSEGAWEAAEISRLAAIAPLTLKPLTLVLNVEESALDQSSDIEGAIMSSLELEAEAAGLPPSEGDEILRGYGIDLPIRERLLRSISDSLRLITFYVTDAKESRAIQIINGSTALDAAGHLHTDMQKGFIRAEVCAFTTVAEAGSWEAARSAGLTRVEGKGYSVEDGDVVRFRFSV